MTERKMKCFLLLGSGIAAFLIGEIFLRILDFSYPNFYEYNDLIGARLRPRAEGWFRREGDAYIRINSQGLRDREHALKKPDGTIRIAVLGDSYAEAFQVPLEKTFWAIMGQLLEACQVFGEKQVEVINFGVSGYGTAQEFLTLQHYVWDYSPDIIVLAFLTGNDIRNNSKSLETTKPLIPFFELEDGMLTLDNSFVEHPEYVRKTGVLWSLRRWIYRYSRIYQLASKTKRLLTSKATNNPGELGEEEGLDDWVYRKPENAEQIMAWAITEHLLIAMRDEVERRKARLVVALLTNGIQVYPNSSVRQHFMKTRRITDLFYPDKHLLSFGEQEGIEMIALAPIFQSHAEEDDIFFHGFENTTLGFGHWNEAGHRFAGEILARHFCQDAERYTAHRHKLRFFYPPLPLPGGEFPSWEG